MAGVYIQNMKLPTVCDECESGFVHTIGCTKRMFFNDRSVARHPECPLQFVQDHGRLIDADVLKEKIDRIYGRYDAGIISELTLALQLLGAIDDETPTVIPADKEAT